MWAAISRHSTPTINASSPKHVPGHSNSRVARLVCLACLIHRMTSVAGIIIPKFIVRRIGDTDGDGMPDDWERTHGLNPKEPSDGNKDRDGDGYTNLEEYLGSLVGEFQSPTK